MRNAIVSLVIFAWLAACGPTSRVTRLPAVGETAAPVRSLAPSQENLTASVRPSVEETLMVAYAKDADLHLWDAESNQSKVIVKAGDITTVTMSNDGQVIAFLRRSLVEQPDLVECISLWAVDRDGKNPRELISAESLRQRLNTPATDSAGFAQIDWIPGTHRLVYNASKHYLPGQGSTYSKDIYLLDADTGADTVLSSDIMPDRFVNDWRFAISPDGEQIALFSATELSFINVDGSNWRPAVLTYPAVGAGDAVLLPSGVWTEDSSAFVFTGPMQSESIHILNYMIWRVPADGSPPQSLATLTNSNSSYITFSPDGERMTFFQDSNGDGVIQIEDHQIMPLMAGVGPLALPSRDEQSYVRWSPGGAAFVVKEQNLFQLCPDATSAMDVCGDPIPLGSGSDLIDRFEWVDEDRFLYIVLEPATLSLGKLDGTIIPIVSSSEDESLDGWSFSVGR